MKRKIGLILVVCFFLPGFWNTLSAQIKKGPYLQKPGPTTMTVMWESYSKTATLLFYGTTSPPKKQYWDLNKVYIHEVTLKGLKPDTVYYYRISGFSTIWKFKTAPSTRRPFRFAVYGDTRTTPMSHRAVCLSMILSRPEFSIHVGDIVTDGRRYDLWQREWYDPAKELVNFCPYITVLGNHERNSHWYYDFFSLPKGSGTEAWYYFDYAGVLFLGLDSDQNFRPGSPQYKFASNVLGKKGYKFKIVMFHHPPYTNGGSYYQSLCRYARTYLVPLFESKGVDLVLNGHDHHYERSYKAGITYIVTGGGGAPLGNPKYSHNIYSKKKARIYHHCTVDIAGEILVLMCVKNDGSVFDKTVIDKDPLNSAPSFRITPSGNVKNPPTITFQWMDPDGWTDLDLNSLRIYYNGPRGTDVTMGFMMLATMGTPFAKVEIPDPFTIRLTVKGLYWPNGTYWWAITGKDKTGVPDEAESTMTVY